MRFMIQGLFALTVGCAAVPVWSGMTFGNYQPARHDRFYQGSDRSFLGQEIDWSGAGCVSSGSARKWATLISPSFFLSSAHWEPETGNTIRFYHGNDLSGTYEERTVIGGVQLGNSDVWIGQLASAVSSKIKPYALIDHSSISPGTSDDSLLGQKIWMVGQSTGPWSLIHQAMGRNIITSNTLTDIGHRWDGATGYGTLGDDEASGVKNDSGSPAFIMVQNQPVLVGERFYPSSSGSVAYLTQEIQSYVSFASGLSESIQTVRIPSRTSVPILRQTFQNDSVNMAPQASDQAIQLVKKGAVVIAGSGGTYGDPFGQSENKSLRLLASSSEPVSSVFWEGLQTGVIQGQCLIDVLAKAPDHGSSDTMFNLMIGHDYYGDSALNANPSQVNESILDVSLRRDGRLQIQNNEGVFVSDQMLEFDEKHRIQVLWRSQASNDAYGDVLVDGQTMTADNGQTRRFKLKNLGNSTTDSDRIDSVYLTSSWNGHDGDSEIYIDNLYLLDIPEPAGLSLLAFSAVWMFWRRRSSC